MKTFLLVWLLAIAEAALGALGETKSQCSVRYGERIGTGPGDGYHSENTTAIFFLKSAKTKGGTVLDVVFNRDGKAIELKFYGNFSEAEIAARLAENGSGWEIVRPKLGSAMEARKMKRWKGPGGRTAELEAGNGAQYFRIFEPERIEQFRSRNLNESPKP